MWSTLIGALLCCWSLCAAAGELKPFRLVAGELPPYATEKGEGAPGSLIELSTELARRNGYQLNVEFYPWQRALLMASNLQHVGILPLTRTPEREKQYRWLARLYYLSYAFVAPHGKLDMRDIDKLKDKRVSVLRGSPHLKVLVDDGFKHVAECATVADCLRMLKAGIVDASYGSEAIYRSSASNKADFDFSQTYRWGEIWLGGSLDFSDADVAGWQAAMKTMRSDGSYKRWLRKHDLPPDRD